MTASDHDQQTGLSPAGCLTRRALLFAGGAASVVLAAGCDVFEFPGGTQLEVATYPRKRIVGLGEIAKHKPVFFSYPGEAPLFASFLVDLGERAAQGVGPAESIVAFNAWCTHMGGPLAGTYKPEHAVAGPCPLHLTTFDLRRHGMVVSGHATETLPQVRLEVEGDDVFATGVMGLIFGVDRNVA